jgi:predicted RNase H-like HicB family nuclease
MRPTYRIMLEPGQDGGYVVRVPALPGCFSPALERALERAHEAIEVHVAGLPKSGPSYLREIPRQTRRSAFPSPSRSLPGGVEPGSDHRLAIV